MIHIKYYTVFHGVKGKYHIMVSLAGNWYTFWPMFNGVRNAVNAWYKDRRMHFVAS